MLFQRNYVHAVSGSGLIDLCFADSFLRTSSESHCLHNNYLAASNMSQSLHEAVWETYFLASKS